MNTEISDPPLMLRLIRTWRRRKSSFSLCDTSGMPTWLGANARAHVQAEPGQLHSEERECSVRRQDEEHQEGHSSEAEREKTDFDPAPLNLLPADDPG